MEGWTNEQRMDALIKERDALRAQVARDADEVARLRAELERREAEAKISCGEQAAYQRLAAMGDIFPGPLHAWARAQLRDLAKRPSEYAALRARVERAEAALTERTQERDALAAALKKYGQHVGEHHPEGDVPCIRFAGHDCNCGLTAALRDAGDCLAARDAAQQAIGAKEWREKYEFLAHTHALLGHDCDTSGQCDADCEKCAAQRRDGAVAALKLAAEITARRTPNMAFRSEIESLYDQIGDGEVTV